MHGRKLFTEILSSRLALIAIAIVLVMAQLIVLWRPAQAANFTMQTGYYMGSGAAGLTVSNVGFQPDFVMIKSSTAAGIAVFKTSAMPANTIAYTSATANDTATNITLTSDGFSLGTLAAVNSANVLYHWIAVGGSDCSATGNFCVGTYTGNGAATRNITTGFQPAMALVKRSTAVAGHYRLASEPANETLFLTNTARDTTGAYIRTFGANNFQVGSGADNVNTGVYYYVTFAASSGAFAQGTYAGNATDNRSITGVGFQPDFVLTKNATSTTANDRRPLMNFSESYGDSSSHVGVATANTVNGIQALENDGFQVGTDASSNGNAATMYWFALGGASVQASSGSFSMATGTYTGTGASNPITGLGFQPDLVIIKADTAQLAVFRTKLMFGDSTAHLSSGTANFTGGITSLNADGFTVGTATQTNSNGIVYQWQAFGNAYNPHDNSGANDFMVGAFYGNGIDNRNVTRMPWQPDMVTIKRNGASAAAWRPSSQAGDNSSFFGATAQTANYIQAFNTDGFQVGTNAAVNTLAANNYWFAFKNGANFSVGSYTGSGSSQNITDAGIRAEYVWIKRTTAINGMSRSASSTDGSSQYFAATANTNDRITKFVKGGFRVGGSQTETNQASGTYYYAAWNDADYGNLSLDIVNASEQSVATPTFALSNFAYSFGCRSITGNLGEANQRIRVSNLTTTAGWSVSIAATDGATALWRNTGNSQQYDFNDANGGGCSDGGDSDTKIGQLSFNPGVATSTPENGCTNTNTSLGAQAGFSEGIVNSIELMSANNSADADCEWDITDIDLTQFIPAEQPIDSYDINLTITIVAN